MSSYTVEELMVTAVARELQDDEVCFVGIGTGGRAFVLAVAIPLVACRLAQLSHAPNLTLVFGPLVNPDFTRPPASLTDRELVRWPCQAQIPGMDALDIFKRGRMDVGFISGSQIDRHGNLNIVSIGEYARPQVRLVGPLAQTDHAAHAKRTIVVMEHEQHRFVERVDFISGVGHLSGGETRKGAGLRGGGPAMVITPLGIFRFPNEKKVLRLESTTPGISLDEIQQQTGCEFEVADSLHETPAPTAAQIQTIRAQIDPWGRFLQGGLVRLV
jgi:glutaconate CoA-transferase subunit B